MARTDDWFIPLSDPAGAYTHLYAFPQAGGGTTTFAELAGRLAPECCVWALNLPGRQARFHEPPRTILDTLLDEVVAQFAARDRPVLLGYCSGALLAFLLARRMRQRGMPPPAALVVLSYPAPDRARPPRGLHRLDTEDFWREILSYGGVADKVAAQPDFRQIFEPALRGDYALLADYRYRPEAPLEVPVTVIHGRDDPVLDPGDVDAWRAHTTRAFGAVAVPGDHWLLNGDPAELASAVRAAVPPAEPARPGSDVPAAPAEHRGRDVIERLRVILERHQPVEDPDANFFEAGFSSSTLVDVSAALRAQGFEIDLVDMYRYPTVRTLAAELHRRAAGAPASPADAARPPSAGTGVGLPWVR